ncbi:hypothetical protein J6590_021414 [Homalodisca vitripennis]|nr:hypothetical protein J6590_021414 [Homalodisca vitripennis]
MTTQRALYKIITHEIKIQLSGRLGNLLGGNIRRHWTGRGDGSGKADDGEGPAMEVAAEQLEDATRQRRRCQLEEQSFVPHLVEAFLTSIRTEVDWCFLSTAPDSVKLKGGGVAGAEPRLDDLLQESPVGSSM